MAKWHVHWRQDMMEPDLPVEIEAHELVVDDPYTDYIFTDINGVTMAGIRAEHIVAVVKVDEEPPAIDPPPQE